MRSATSKSSFCFSAFLCGTKTTEDNRTFTFLLLWWSHEAERAQTGACRPRLRVFVSGDHFDLFWGGLEIELAFSQLAVEDFSSPRVVCENLVGSVAATAAASTAARLNSWCWCLSDECCRGQALLLEPLFASFDGKWSFQGRWAAKSVSRANYGSFRLSFVRFLR